MSAYISYKCDRCGKKEDGYRVGLINEPPFRWWTVTIDDGHGPPCTVKHLCEECPIAGLEVGGRG